MTNIWGFLLQTLSVSLAAALLLLLKYLLEDKLSPRWQYGVWSILALRILLPVNMARYILLPLPLWLETWKASAEQQLTAVSSFSSTYTPIKLFSVFPVITGSPASITDWLFIIYLSGVLVCLVWYCISYIRLRILLLQGLPVSEKMQVKLQLIYEEYHLPSCKCMKIPGLPSAFVCGFIHPILVIPADQDSAMDYKILLHELLHLKYRDSLQNVFWCILRALHWCNPFLQYVFNRIGNDMESLCDQRVLELLEGEERRAYGGILLGMVNERYARTPFTSSISNGGKNIARRITAIVHFKKYPRGMALVSICIIFVLLFPTITGTASDYDKTDYQPQWESELEQALAITRIHRCTTIAGALDTYAKGLMLNNGLYIATASPLSRQAELAGALHRSAQENDWMAYHLSSGNGLEIPNMGRDYQIMDLVENADGSYNAWLVLSVQKYAYDDDTYWIYPRDGGNQEGCLFIPVTVRHEDAWVVEERGERIFSPKPFEDAKYPGSDLPWIKQLTAEGENGTITISLRNKYQVDNTIMNSNNHFNFGFLSSSSFDDSPKTDAAFGSINVLYYTEYTYRETPDTEGPKHSVGLQIAPLSCADEEPDFPEDSMSDIGISGGRSDGYSWTNINIAEKASWDGTVSDYGSNTYYGLEKPVDFPGFYRVRVFWDGQMVEEFALDDGMSEGFAPDGGMEEWTDG